MIECAEYIRSLAQAIADNPDKDNSWLDDSVVDNMIDLSSEYAAIIYLCNAVLGVHEVLSRPQPPKEEHDGGEDDDEDEDVE